MAWSNQIVVSNYENGKINFIYIYIYICIFKYREEEREKLALVWSPDAERAFIAQKSLSLSTNCLFLSLDSLSLIAISPAGRYFSSVLISVAILPFFTWDFS